MSKKCTPLWREAHFQVKMYKTHHSGTTFGSCDVEKVHAVVAQSTFPSQNVQKTPGSDHFWKLRCRKSACRCGTKHISKSKCTKQTKFGPLLEVEMSKKCTPLARSTFPSQNVQNTRFSGHLWKLRCRKSARRCGAKHILKSNVTKHTRFGPLLEVAMSKKCTPLWREAHFEVKCYKTHQVWTTFGSCDVEKVHAVVARSTFPSQMLQNTPGSDTFASCDVEKVRAVHAVVARSTFPSQSVQNTTCSRHFWGSDVGKVYTVVARSTFPSQNAQSTTCSRHFWRFGC